MIERILYKAIADKLFKGKIIILSGARQVGKTTLLKQIMKENKDVLWLNGDEMQVQNLFDNASADRLLSEFGNYSIVILDEAQRIKDIGLRLKLIADSDSDIQMIATGSSAFELANNVNEPLTGRKWEYQMFRAPPEAILTFDNMRYQFLTRTQIPVSEAFPHHSRQKKTPTFLRHTPWKESHRHLPLCRER